MHKIIFLTLIMISTHLPAAVVSNAGGEDRVYLEGIGISLAKKHILTSNMFFDENLLEVEDKDNIFISHEIFFDYFPASNSEIDYQYGLGFNFGYGYKKWDFYTGLGVIRSAFEYDDNTQLKDYERNGIYYSFGAGYNVTQNFAVKLQGKTYEINFRDDNGDKTNLRNNSLNLVLGIGF